MPISPAEMQDKLTTTIEAAWQRLFPYLGSANYRGCIVMISDVHDPKTSFVIDYGDTKPHTRRLTELADEKTARLRSNHREHGHMTSAQSRNPHATLLGGAIIAGDAIIAVAGLTEDGDESLGLDLACRLNWMPPEGASLLASISNNTLYPTLA